MTVSEVDLLIYTHRWSPLQVRLIESIASHTKHHQYAIHVVQRTGSAHINLNRAWRRATANYAVIFDEDVQLLQDGWLDGLIMALEQDQSLGIVGCQDLQTDAQLCNITEPYGVVLEYREWVPGYVMAFKRERVPFLRFDEAIPGAMGMSDLDACLQITSHQLKVARNLQVVVYHPMRIEDETRIREERPTMAQLEEWFPAQVGYMIQKWGETYSRLIR